MAELKLWQVPSSLGLSNVTMVVTMFSTSTRAHTELIHDLHARIAISTVYIVSFVLQCQCL